MPPDRDLTIILIHASAALRRKRDALDALDRRRPDHDAIPPEVAIGEASEGAVSLFLAVEAATRFCSRYPTPGPLGPIRLAKVRTATKHLRDAVMHWDEKGRRDEWSMLTVDGRGIVASAPPRNSNESIVNGISWADFDRAANGLVRWAEEMQRLPADEV